MQEKKFKQAWDKVKANKGSGEIAKRVIEELGLEVAMDKTRYVDFNKDNFKFIGIEFHH